MKLEGKNALVTGSDQGIGQAVALALAEQGADVVVTYRRNREGAEATRDLVRKMGRNCAVIQADVADLSSARKLVEESVAALSEVDILVNNAGVEKRASFLDVTERLCRGHTGRHDRAVLHRPELCAASRGPQTARQADQHQLCP